LLAVLSVSFLASPVLAFVYGLPARGVLWVLTIWLLASGWMWLYWRSTPTGRLFWDGEQWHWSGGNPGGAQALQAVAIQYDFQQSLWVLLQPQSGARFGLWIDADPRRMEQWRAFRRALVGAAGRPMASADTLY
jgi:hypothetical protein